MTRKKVPLWLKTLPFGSYTIPDLQRISQTKCRHSLKNVMLKYGAQIIKERKCNKNIFMWSGFECDEQISLYVEENGKTYLYQKVKDTQELSREVHLMSTSQGWFKRMFEVEKIYIEKKVS